MGRQAYLARLALGRSAFEAPLKDENGEFILGAGARVNDDRSHYQEWDDRGHPQNKKSEDAAKNYRMSQNRILEACGVLVKRNALEKVKKENSKRASETEIVMSEYDFGEWLKISDSAVGFALTWWTTTLRRRLITFGAFDRPMMSSIGEGLRHKAISFFSAGLAFHTAAFTLRRVRHLLNAPEFFTEFVELDVEQNTTLRTFAKLTVFSASVMLFLSEIPLDIASSLSSLGLPTAATTTSIFKYWPTSSDRTGPDQYLWLRLLSYVYFRERVAYDIGLRLFAVFDHCFTQPRYPSPASAAVCDEITDPSSIPMEGRSINSQTYPSFLRRPVNFMTALCMAFSPGWRQSQSAFDEMLSKEKQHILRTIAEYELESGCQSEFDTASDLVRVRVASIVQWLVESKFQVAHFKFTNFDLWAEEVDYHIDELQRERANVARAQVQHVGTRNGQDEDRSGEIEFENRRNESPSSNSAIAGTDARSVLFDLVRQQRDAGTMLLSPMRSSTPEPGIRRATSLVDSTAENGHLSSTASVVVNGSSSNDVQACVRRVYLEHRISGPPQRGNGEHRVTRLSTFAAESLAWHMSSIITSLLVLPIDSAVCRLITLCSSRLIGTAASSSVVEISPVLGMHEWFGGPRAGWLGRWRYASMLALTFGLESLVRFGVWRIGVGVALRQAEFYQWGSF